MKTHQHLLLKIWKSKHALFTCLPIYIPVNSGVALEFSLWLTAICCGGISESQSQQTASRAMKFLKFCSGEDEDELTSSFIDYCLGCPRLITDFAEVLKNEWKIGSSAQLSYLHAITDFLLRMERSF